MTSSMALTCRPSADHDAASGPCDAQLGAHLHQKHTELGSNNGEPCTPFYKLRLIGMDAPSMKWHAPPHTLLDRVHYAHHASVHSAWQR